MDRTLALVIPATAEEDEMSLVKCEWCKRDAYPNEVRFSELHDCLVCRDCDADSPTTHGEIQQRKRERARGKAWQEGMGWVK